MIINLSMNTLGKIVSKKALRLSDNGWHSSDLWTNLNNKRILNSTVILKGFGDLHPYRNGPKFSAETVYVYNCDKNFVYYWINRSTFPNVKKLYLLSHPCEPPVLNQNIPEFYLEDGYYRRYKDRWASHNDNVKSVIASDVLEEIKTYEDEDVISEPNESKE